jgi:hypothetical protein
MPVRKLKAISGVPIAFSDISKIYYFLLAITPANRAAATAKSQQLSYLRISVT